MTNEDPRRAADARLKRVVGQLSGVQRMIADGRSRAEILLQLSAARAALSEVGRVVLGEHVEACLTEALAAEDEGTRKEKIDELLDVLGRYGGSSLPAKSPP